MGENERKVFNFLTPRTRVNLYKMGEVRGWPRASRHGLDLVFC